MEITRLMWWPIETVILCSVLDDRPRFGVGYLSHRLRVTKSSEVLFQDSGITFPCKGGSSEFLRNGIFTYKKARTWRIQKQFCFASFAKPQRKANTASCRKVCRFGIQLQQLKRNELILLAVADVYRCKADDN